MNIPAELKYTQNDEWVKVEGSTATVGVTDYAQEQLSDIVFVEILLSVDEEAAQGASCATVESVKAAADVYLPVSGTVTEINEALPDTPEQINSDPYGAAWMVKLTLSNPAELDGLMDAAAYEAYCASRAH